MKKKVTDDYGAPTKTSSVNNCDISCEHTRDPQARHTLHQSPALSARLALQDSNLAPLPRVPADSSSSHLASIAAGFDAPIVLHALRRRRIMFRIPPSTASCSALQKFSSRCFMWLQMPLMMTFNADAPPTPRLQRIAELCKDSCQLMRDVTFRQTFSAPTACACLLGSCTRSFFAYQLYSVDSNRTVTK